MTRFRMGCVSAGLLLASACGAVAQSQPIKSPEDARCRDEARAHVFTDANPKRLAPYEFGASLYHACMRRLGAEPEKPQRR